MSLVKDYFTKGIRKPTRDDKIGIVIAMPLFIIAVYGLILFARKVAGDLVSTFLVLSITILVIVVMWRSNPLFQPPTK